MGAIAGILQIVNLALPLVTNVIVSFKKNATTGNVDITVTLSQADAAFQADIKQAQEWLAAHPAP